MCDASFLCTHIIRMQKCHPMDKKYCLLIVNINFKVHTAIMMKMENKEGTKCLNRLWAVNQVLVFKNSFTF